MGAGSTLSIAAWLAIASPGRNGARGPEPATLVECAPPPGARGAADEDACWSAGGGMLVRRDRGGGAAGVRRLPALRGAAVDAIAAHRGIVWLGLSAARDGARAPLGLVRYDWARDRAYAFRGTDAGPCGFFVHDLLVHEDTLWVATDLGVSRLGLSPDIWDEWTHFATGVDGAEAQETACATLLGRVADARAAPGGEIAARWLAEFRPRFWRRHSRRNR